MNPYTDELDDTFRGHKVTVTCDAGTYTGYARIFHFNEQEVILHGATKGGDHVGSVTITDYDTIERADAPPIEEVPVTDIRESPYAARTYDDADLDAYVRQLRQRGALYSFPTARPAPDADAAYELLGGHKRTEAATRASFDTIPVRIVERADWAALRHFVDEHIPLNDDELQSDDYPNRGWYSREEIRASLDKMRARWDDAELREIPAVAHWLDELVPTARPTPRLTVETSSTTQFRSHR